MLEKTFDELLNLGVVFAILAIIIGVLFWLWQKAEAALKSKEIERLQDQKDWQKEFKEQEIRHAGELKNANEENRVLSKARLDNALDMLTFVRNMEDAIKKGDVREAIETINKAIESVRLMVRKIAKKNSIDLDE